MRRIVLILILACLFQVAQAQLTAGFGASDSTLDCNTLCVNFSDLSTGGVPTSWQWYFPGASPATSTVQNPLNICYQVDGDYDVTLIVSDGIDTVTLTQTAFINVQSVPGAFVTPDVSIPFGSAIQLNAGGGASYTWNPATGLSDPAIPDPVASPVSTTAYTVTITSGTGCSTVLYVTVYVIQDNNLFVPTAFSPNGDGYNEILYLRGNNFQSVEFSVYDRWGTKVFETTDQGRGWDGTFKGKRSEAGTYTFTAVISYDDGVSQTISGKTTLIR